MAVVTAIRPQVKNKDRCSIDIDGRFFVGLSLQAVLERKLKVGLELGDEELQELKAASGDDLLLQKAIDYALMRPRSVWEMQSYFKRKKIPASTAEGIEQKLVGYKLLDDTVFAERWVANRRLLKSMSKRKLQAELRAKRVPAVIVQEVMAADDTDDRDALREMVAKKRQQTRYKDTDKLMQYLARQGFMYEDIKSVLQEDS